jgi:hypothetical protein
MSKLSEKENYLLTKAMLDTTGMLERIKKKSSKEVQNLIVEILLDYYVGRRLSEKFHKKLAKRWKLITFIGIEMHRKLSGESTIQ